MTKKKDESRSKAQAEAKKAESDKKYARLPDKLVATLPAADVKLDRDQVIVLGEVSVTVERA